MIPVTDLRYGNWLFIPGRNVYVKVVAIFNTHFRCENNNGVQYEESVRVNYCPIPLTPELLEKAGFEIIADGARYEQDRVKLYPDEQGFYFINEVFHRHIDHVHTLQNWWHANTGTELTITL